MTATDSPKRITLNRHKVLSAALEIADAHGLDALSMRRLGDALGVEAMSLYNHVVNKDDLVDGMLDVVVSEFALPPHHRPWKAALRESAISAHAALLRHPWACGLLMARQGAPMPARIEYMEEVLAAMERGGLSPALVHHGLHAYENHIFGFTMSAIGFPYRDDELRQLADDFLADFPLDDRPHMVRHVREHIEADFAAESGFEFGLDLVLDGLERAANE